MPVRFEAAILSRIRSAVTSRSNCAKDRSTFRVSRPIELVVLNACVTETKDTPAASKISTIFAKSDSARVSRSTLQTTTVSTRPARTSSSSRCSPDRFMVPPEIPPSS